MTLMSTYLIIKSSSIVKSVRLAVLIILIFSKGYSQLQVNGNFTPSQLVNQILLGPGVVATNITYTGANNAIGFFKSTMSNVGLDSGIIMTTGFRNGAIGPNNSGNVSGIQNKPGDADLTQICGQATKDACVLEFDFVPSSDTVSFNYVFASEEYNEGVCTPFNDVFAFLISGPGINGQQNIALVPNTSLPVAISSVNGGTIGDPTYLADSTYPYCHLNNTQYFISNFGIIAGNIQYDGLTVVLTAKAVVIPCSTYHIKLAIADGGNDDTWDSAVFLEAGSFNSRYVTVDTNPILIGAVSDSSLYEGCSEAIVKFTRYDSIAFPRNLNFTLNGSANFNQDYGLNYSAIHFAPGQDTLLMRIRPTFDQLSEGSETIILEIIPDFIVCNGWKVPGIELKIEDQPQLNAYYSVITPECPYDSLGIIVSAQGGAQTPYYFQYPEGNNWMVTNTFQIPVIDRQQFTIEVRDSCYNQTVAVHIITDYNCDPYLPNIITNNADGLNDALFFKDLYKFGEVEIAVYNRFGNLLFYSKNYMNDWNPNELSAGVYYYVLSFTSGKKFNGFFQLIK